MSNLDQRIAQWEQMAREAPDDMAYFSLGSAYREAERLEEAAEAFKQATDLNPNMSRAYQLRGQCLLELGNTDEAQAVLTDGYKIAAERGDVMPQKAMGSLLEQKLGAELPEVATPEPTGPELTDENSIIDQRTGKPQPKLDGPPMRGPLGEFIAAHFGQITWQEWIRQGTKVINELRLDFSNPEHQAVYDRYMLEWLQVTEDDVKAFVEEQGK